MELTKGQQDAVEMVRKLAFGESTHSEAILAGPAGSGKTTCLKAVIEMLKEETDDHEPCEFIVVAPTNRAARRVTELTGEEAMTIHSMLYRPLMSGGKLIGFLRRDDSELPVAQLVIVEESSMIPRSVYDDVSDAATSMGAKLLFVGDNAQLPPVDPTDKTGFSVFTHVKTPNHVTLTEVMRQALDSPILKAATAIRLCTRYQAAVRACGILPGLGEDASIAAWLARRRKAGTDAAIIVHSNDLRRQVNHGTRAELGLSSAETNFDRLLQVGEPVLVRRGEKELGLFTGDVHPFNGWEPDPIVPSSRDKWGRGTLKGKVGNAVVRLEPSVLQYGVEQKTVKRPNDEAMDSEGKAVLPRYLNAEYGYALTAHAAQGSEWKEVLVVLSKSLFAIRDESERIRWLYTAVTRGRNVTAIVNAG